MPGFISRLSILFHWSIFLFFAPKPYSFDYCSFSYSLKSGTLIFTARFFFLKIALIVHGLLCFYTNCKFFFVLLLWKMLLLGLTLFNCNSLNLKVKVAQLCPMLCDPMHYILQGSFFHGILQARILEWVTIPFSRGSSQPRSPALQANPLQSEPPGKPKNITRSLFDR